MGMDDKNHSGEMEFEQMEPHGGDDNNVSPISERKMSENPRLIQKQNGSVISQNNQSGCLLVTQSDLSYNLD